MRQQLRVFLGDDFEPADPGTDMMVTLGDILDILQEAVDTRRNWLRDFTDEPIRISSDLHEVLATYRHVRTGA